MAAPLSDQAYAKVNLTLRVTGRRPDGYHELDSVVVFARVADRLRLEPGPVLDLSVRGPTAAAAGRGSDNLVLKAARALIERIDSVALGRFILFKQIPVAAGLGGGSADAAAALRLLALVNGLAMDDPRLADAAVATGADVPVCLDPRPRRMTGIGEVLSDVIDLPVLPAVLVNPGVAVPTRDVFAAITPPPPTRATGSADSIAEHLSGRFHAVAAALAASRNDLESPAIRIQPVIADTLAALRALPGCVLARMSGSGATCFGLFPTLKQAHAAARALGGRHPGWWVKATVLGSPAQRERHPEQPHRPGAAPVRSTDA